MKKKQQVKLVPFLVFLLLIIGLVSISLLAGRRERGIKGPGKMVAGAGGTLYIHINDLIAHVSGTGDLIETFDLARDLDVHEPMVDFMVDHSGRFIIGLEESRKIVKVFPGGSVVHEYPFFVEETKFGMEPFFRFTLGPQEEVFYFVDSDPDVLRLFGPDDVETARVTKAEGKAFNWPNGVVFQDGTLYVADANNQRIVVMDPEGTVLKTIRIKGPGTRRRYNPFDLSVQGTVLAVVHGDPYAFDSGIMVFDLASGTSRSIDESQYSVVHPGFIPDEIFVFGDDILVADPWDANVIRFSPEGAYLGEFGAESFRDLIHDVRSARSFYKSVRKIALWGIIFVLIALIVFRKKLQTSPAEKGDSPSVKDTGKTPPTAPSVSKKMPALAPPKAQQSPPPSRAALVPLSFGRRVLYTAVPVAGHFAAGKKVRGLVMLLVLLVLAALNVLVLVGPGPSQILVLGSMGGFTLLGLWALFALDALRLHGRKPGRRGVEGLAIVVGLPLAAVVCAVNGQAIWELLVNGHELSFSLQEIFQKVLSWFGAPIDSMSIFAALHIVGVLFGWAGAGAAMFAVASLAMDEPAERAIWATFAGLAAGLASWIITGVVAGSVSGSAFWEDSLQGAVLGLFFTLFFFKRRVSLLVIPLAAAGAFVGNSISSFIGVPMGLFMKFLPMEQASTLTGMFTRAESVVLPAYFVTMAAMLVINALGVKKASLISRK